MLKYWLSFVCFFACLARFSSSAQIAPTLTNAVRPDVTYLPAANQCFPTSATYGTLIATNIIYLLPQSIYPGDVLFIQTIGDYSIGRTNSNGVLVYGPEIPQPILGLFVSNYLNVGCAHLIPTAAQTTLPQYVTPAYETSSGASVSTDIPQDFLVPTNGVTVTVPYGAFFLAFGETDPNVRHIQDTNLDFRVVIQPLQQLRFEASNNTVVLSVTNMYIGQTLTATVYLTNTGNVTIEGLTANQPSPGLDGVVLYSSDSLQFMSGPVVSATSLAPGDTASIQYTYKAIGTNAGYVQIFPQFLDTNGDLQTYIRGWYSLEDAYPTYFFYPKFALTTTVSVTPNRVDVGDQFQVIVSAQNVSDETLTNVQISGAITNAGSGEVTFVSVIGDTVANLAPGETANFTNLYTATNYGKVNFTAATSGEGLSGLFESPPGTSPNLAIEPNGDLQVKTADPADTNFVGIGEYQEPPPFNDQNLTLSVGSNGVAGYVVRLENASRYARSYVLRGATNSFANWALQVMSGNVSILNDLYSDAGWTSPVIAVGADVDLQVTLAPNTNAGVLDNKSLLITSYADSTNTDVLDSVLLHALLVPVPVQITLRAVTDTGYTLDSVDAGLTNIDAPLVPVTAPAVLDQQPEIHGGLVADGVTPLVLKLSADPASIGQFANGLDFSFQATILGGGSLAGTPLAQRLQVIKNGVWQSATDVVLSASSPNAYVQILPIMSDELSFTVQPAELDIDFSVTDNTSGVQAGDVKFAFRKPPIALIHGYNTAGDWGSGFQTILGTSRPVGFVRTVKYGQDQVTSLPTYIGVPVYVNTVATLDECSQLALESFNQIMGPIHNAWAFTRYDVVGHSQGGVLTRMLCNEFANNVISTPFRNADNFNRGRFHRVVTIGSPHNGTRMLHYLLKQNELGKSNLYKTLPQLVSTLGVLLDIAQAKFDPFGPQFQEINDPSNLAPWKPDPGARFHLVRPTIDYGASPGPYDLTPLYVILGLTATVGGGGGAAVIPRGSDGVVDFDSMGANVPPAPVAPNVFTLPPGDLVSHSDPIKVFGAVAAETGSTDVAQHVIDALDQNPFMAAADRVFASFPLPPLLDASQEALIDNFAELINYQTVSNILSLLPQQTSDGSNYQFQIAFPGNLPPQGSVAWSVEVYGPLGITSDGVTLASQGLSNSVATISVGGSVVGDVVVSATYLSANNTVVITPPALVTSRNPPGLTLTGIQVLPGNIALPVGTTVSPQVVAHYSDGSSLLRYVTAGAITVVSSQPQLVSVQDPINWQINAIGTANVTLTWSGLSSVAEITGFASTGTTPPTLSLRNQDNGQLTATWPSYTTNFQLESTENLSDTNSWQTVAAALINAGGQRMINLSFTNAQQFYRLRRQQ